MAEAVWGEGQDGGASLCRFLPIWVENKMAELLCLGFYLFGVKEVKMEAHHHGGANLG